MGTPSANPLNGLELTGRSDAHVAPLPGSACRLHPAAGAAFLALQAAARADGLELLPVSGYRDFDRQLALWNGKFRGERVVLDRAGQPVDMAPLDAAARIAAILVWSALPGASRHHWGSDLDVVDAGGVPPGGPVRLEAVDFAPGGRHAALEGWLARRAADFGFFRPYDRDRGGVQPEPWHLSWAPLAVPALAAMDAGLVAAALAQADLDGRAEVLAALPALYGRFVAAVAGPAPAALAAVALSRAARPA